MVDFSFSRLVVGGFHGRYGRWSVFCAITGPWAVVGVLRYHCVKAVSYKVFVIPSALTFFRMI